MWNSLFIKKEERNPILIPAWAEMVCVLACGLGNVYFSKGKKWESSIHYFSSYLNYEKFEWEIWTGKGLIDLWVYVWLVSRVAINQELQVGMWN